MNTVFLTSHNSLFQRSRVLPPHHRNVLQLLWRKWGDRQRRTRCANTVDWNSLRTFLGHCWPWGSHAVDLPWVMGNRLVDCCVGMSTQHCQVPGQSCWAVPSRRVFVPVDFRHTLFTVDSVQKSDWNQHSPSPITGFPSFSPLGKRDSLKLFTEKIKEDRVIKILWQLLMINCHRRTQWQPKLSQSPVSPVFD